VRTDLLIIGAGPYGLALAAYARHLEIDHRVVGRPMGFWTEHMPAGMYLRSASDWSLDPLDARSIPAFLATRGQCPADAEPLSRECYLEYARWFQERRGIEARSVLVRRLDAESGRRDRFIATTDGGVIAARFVALAIGFSSFASLPPEVVNRVPAGRYAHTCDLVAFNELEGQRCLIIGGRQSAFEWAALLREAGAASVHVAHRHASPAFRAADWSWVAPAVEGMVEDPGWFRRLSPEGQDAIGARLWAEGRLKVEPWLESRVRRDGVHLWPETRVTGFEPDAGGALSVRLEPGPRLTVDHVVLATGYKVQLRRVPFLASGNLLPEIAADDGYPRLSERFETSVPGLFITSMPATRDFGPFFAFTVGVRASAVIIAREIDRQRRAESRSVRSA
jgi:FAD-dependent urate hydroxylase